MGWIQAHDWQFWLIAALLLAGFEMATLDLTLLMMAVGAAAGCLAAVFGASIVAQVIIAVAVAVGMLAFVRPPIVRKLHAGPTLVNGPKALVGTSGLVLERVTDHDGRVKLRGEVWSARTLQEAQVIEPGSKVAVAEIDGATAVVYLVP
jgi:membrane protein implicated in regulation of membrane protease activity